MVIINQSIMKTMTCKRDELTSYLKCTLIKHFTAKNLTLSRRRVAFAAISAKDKESY